MKFAAIFSILAAMASMTNASQVRVEMEAYPKGDGVTSRTFNTEGAFALGIPQGDLRNGRRAVKEIDEKRKLRSIVRPPNGGRGTPVPTSSAAPTSAPTTSPTAAPTMSPTATHTMAPTFGDGCIDLSEERMDGVTSFVPTDSYGDQPYAWTGLLLAVSGGVVNYFCSAHLVGDDVIATAAFCLVDSDGFVAADYFIFCPQAVDLQCVGGEYDIDVFWYDDSFTVGGGTYDFGYDMAFAVVLPEFIAGTDINEDYGRGSGIMIPETEETAMSLGYPANLVSQAVMVQAVDTPFFHSINDSGADLPVIALSSEGIEEVGGPILYECGLVAVNSFNIGGIPDVIWGPAMRNDFVILFVLAEVYVAAQAYIDTVVGP